MSCVTSSSSSPNDLADTTAKVAKAASAKINDFLVVVVMVFIVVPEAVREQDVCVFLGAVMIELDFSQPLSHDLYLSFVFRL